MFIQDKDKILAQILAARVGLDLIFSESFDTAATDGKTVYFPVRIIEKLENHLSSQNDLRDVFLGLLAHEAAGHIRLTDFTVNPKSGLVRSILNLLEDIRIEMRVPLIFPGARRLLEAVVRHMADPLFWQAKSEETPINLIAFWLMRRLRKEVLDQGGALSEQIFKELGGLISGIPGAMEVAEKCYSIAYHGIIGAQSTGDLLQPAEEIAKLLLSLTTEEDLKRAGVHRSLGGSFQASQAPEGAERGQADHEQPFDDTPQEADCRTAASTAAHLSAEEKQRVYDSLEIKGLDLADAIVGGRGRITMMDLMGGRKSSLRLNGTMSHEEFKKGSKLAAFLRSGLREALRSLVEDEDEAEETFGRFNPRYAALAAKGLRRDVFEIEGEPAPGLDAHIVLMIDKSGSMVRYENGVRAITYGIIDAMGTIPEITLDVIYYDERAMLAPRGALRQREFAKKFSTSGGTDWDSAFFDGVFRIFAMSKRSRKILLTVTDGDVSFNQKTEYAIKQLGVELHFLVIGTSPRPNSVPMSRWVRIGSDSDVWELAKTILAMLKNAMNPICA